MKEKEDKKQNVPKRRFPGFTEPWEQCRVGDLLVERNEQAPMSDEYPLMAFIANEGVAPKGDRYDRSALVTDTKKKLYKKTELGDFIYSSNNLETGSIGLNKYGKASISPVYSIFQPTGIADADFLGRRLVRKDFINSMVKWRQGVIYGQWRIHESDFIEIVFPVPTREEQQKIGAFLDALDHLITLHQRKLDDLKLLKKGLLQKMFPKNGEKVPEIRFPGFTDDWEQRRLGDIANTFKGGGTPKTSVKEYWDGTLPWIQSSDLLKDKLFENIPNKFITEEGLKNSATKLIEANSIAIVTRVGVGKVSFFPYDYATSQDFISFSNLNVDPKFGTYLCYRTLNHINDLQGSAIKGITGESVKLFDITLPNMIEQKQIGKFLYQFDHLITLHQRKLDNLKLLKKGLLQEMFV